MLGVNYYVARRLPKRWAKLVAGPLPNSSAVDTQVQTKRGWKEINTCVEKTYHEKMAGIFPSW